MSEGKAWLETGLEIGGTFLLLFSLNVYLDRIREEYEPQIERDRIDRIDREEIMDKIKDRHRKKIEKYRQKKEEEAEKEIQKKGIDEERDNGVIAA